MKLRYAHLAEDLWEWYFDWISQSPEKEPDFMSMTRDELIESIQKFTKMFIDMIENRSVDYIDLETDNGKLRITFEEFFFHLVNHTTYHRGQIVMGLRILGKDVVMTDYVPYPIQLAESN